NKDTEFVKLLASPEDQQRFEGLTSRPQDKSALAHAVHLSMRDGVGNVVPVEVFHVRTEDVDNQPRHLVGIREYSEELRPQPSFGSSFVGSLSFTSQAPQAPPSALQTAVRNGQASDSDESSNETAGSKHSLEEAWVLIDATSGLQILGASSVFVEKTSVEFNDSSHFLDIVADDERSFFMSAFLQKFEAAAAERTGEFLLSFTAALPEGPCRTRWRFRPEMHGEMFLVRGVLRRLKKISKL
ncbi:unnamed protein product, partial [Symbiodinium pilosum]